MFLFCCLILYPLSKYHGFCWGCSFTILYLHRSLRCPQKTVRSASDWGIIPKIQKLSELGMVPTWGWSPWLAIFKDLHWLPMITVAQSCLATRKLVYGYLCCHQRVFQKRHISGQTQILILRLLHYVSAWFSESFTTAAGEAHLAAKGSAHWCPGSRSSGQDLREPRWR